MRSFTLAASLLSLALIPACSTSEPDELAGEADAEGSSDGKGDSPDGVYTYFEIGRDMNRCAFPMCGGYHLDRLNATNTTCHDGRSAAKCYTPELDWSQSGLSQAQRELFEAAATKGAFDGQYALVRGRFVKKGTTVRPELGKFIVTEAWVAEGEGSAEGVFAKVAQNGVRCIAAPCASLTERALNASRTANIAEIDFAAGELSEASISALIDDTTKPGGIIVAGDRFTFKVSGRSGKGRTATNAFRNLANVNTGSGSCFIGGCSGQICSDREGVISTCEWREEYACYQEATCERQADGACGWTQTAELAACLGE
ncbi:MAG: DUF6748 domain-containing protein [Kofleriaceae bacterium]|nr:DUF6748 domain-containing protein [Kofleriaceae bacterium]